MRNWISAQASAKTDSGPIIGNTPNSHKGRVFEIQHNTTLSYVVFYFFIKYFIIIFIEINYKKIIKICKKSQKKSIFLTPPSRRMYS
jgi:hypothetical protein